MDDFNTVASLIERKTQNETKLQTFAAKDSRKLRDRAGEKELNMSASTTNILSSISCTLGFV
jgi:hypothetical protein